MSASAAAGPSNSQAPVRPRKCYVPGCIERDTTIWKGKPEDVAESVCFKCRHICALSLPNDTIRQAHQRGNADHPACLSLGHIADVIRAYDWMCDHCSECQVCRNGPNDEVYLFCIRRE